MLVGRSGWLGAVVVVVVVVVVVCGLAVPVSAVSGAPSGGSVVVAGRSRVLGAAGPVESASVVRPSAVVPVTYHGGPVLHSSGVFAIFWVPGGYALPAGYESTVLQFFTDVAHDSFLGSNVFGVDTQYYDVTGGVKRFVSYSVVDRGSNVDTEAFPKSGCSNYTLSSGSKSRVCLTDTQVRREIRSVISAHHLPTGLGDDYFVFTPPGVATCETSASAFAATHNCFDPIQQNGYCSYHSYFGSGGQTVLYAPFGYEAPTSLCSSGESPNGSVADSVLNHVAHEENETITDPLGTGWYDSAGNEIADKCQSSWGPSIGSNGGPDSAYNQLINGHGYWLQELWSNRAQACEQRNTFPQPAVSFTYSPAAPVHDKKVTFRSSVSEPGTRSFTYRWTFPNGTTATTANPTRTFAKPVFVGIVTLIVTDPNGDQTRTVKAITVT